MKCIRAGIVLIIAGLLVASGEPIQATEKVQAPETIFETNITKDLNLSSGEPQIAVDPTNARNLALIEAAFGSPKAPAFALNPVLDPKTPEQSAMGSPSLGRLQLSKDGGNTWTIRQAPAYEPDTGQGGGDPMIAYGPDGTLYAADCTGHSKPNQRTVLSGTASLRNVNMWIVASTDGGKTFTAPQPIETPRDRPWLKVDQSTGTVYTASTGNFNPKTKEYNVPGPEAPADRWLTAWKPHLVGHSEPRRIGGPDFSGAGGSTMTAANGILAATFVLGGPSPGGMGRGEPVPIPASLRSVVKDGTTTCSIETPCLFFETSADEGEHWTRHHVPVPGGFGSFFTYVAADPGLPGRYAVGLMNRDATGIRVLVTDDWGESWSEPATVIETPPGNAPSDSTGASIVAVIGQGSLLKPWMDYGPSGVLGLMWKQRRADLSTPPPPSMKQGLGQSWGPAFDVYAAISCDGGKTWLPPARVNAQSSPSGPNGFDDLSYIALDRHYAHLVWGDRRNITKVKNAPTGIGGVQVYYGRVPFSVISHGGACGRDLSF